MEYEITMWLALCSRFSPRIGVWLGRGVLSRMRYMGTIDGLSLRRGWERYWSPCNGMIKYTHDEMQSFVGRERKTAALWLVLCTKLLGVTL